MSSSPAVFVDRDGTMIEDVGYLDRLERLMLFPYTIDAIRLLNRGGFKIVVVTSQAGVAHGSVTEAFLREVHGVITDRVADAGVVIHEGAKNVGVEHELDRVPVARV